MTVTATRRCTAPVVGHVRGSDAERDCPVCGPKAARESLGGLASASPSASASVFDTGDLARRFLNSPEADAVADIVDDPELAAGKCVEASEALAWFLSRQGFDAEVVDLEADGSGIAGDKELHTVVVCRDQVIDMTARQFDPDADVPTVFPYDDLAKHGWRESGHMESEVSKSRDASLSQAQRDFFAGTKVTNPDGSPMRLFHGSSVEFDSFDPATLGRGNDAWGNGFYFTDQESVARGYANDSGSPTANVKEFYLNITNPIEMDGREHMSLVDYRFTPEQARAIVASHPLLSLQPEEEDEDGNTNPLSDYSADYWDRTHHDAEQMETMVNEMIDSYFGDAGWVEVEGFFGKEHGAAFLSAVRDATGHDGVIVDFGEDVGKHYVAWFPEQMKLTSNASPDGTSRF